MKQVRNGHAFEGAIALAMAVELKSNGIDWSWDQSDQATTLLRTSRLHDLPQPLLSQMQSAASQAAKYVVQEHVKKGSVYRLGTGDDARNGDIADVTLRNCVKDVSISCKWNSLEIKGPRFHPKLWAKKYGTCDGSDWIVEEVNLSRLLRDWEDRPWSELKETFGDERLHRLFQQKLYEQIQLVAASEKLSLDFAHEHFGNHDHLKVYAKPKSKFDAVVIIADFKKKDVVSRITLVEKDLANPHWVHVHFGHSFVLGLRLHSRGRLVKKDGMSYSTEVESYARPECRLT